MVAARLSFMLCRDAQQVISQVKIILQLFTFVLFHLYYQTRHLYAQAQGSACDN